VRRELQEERGRSTEVAARARKEIEAVQRDVEEQMPKLTASIADKLERHWTARLNAELSHSQAHYEKQIESLRKELLDMHAAHTEREAR
jgi:S-methylmethionine-dependent homocysteine/selenocysteine methylase